MSAEVNPNIYGLLHWFNSSHLPAGRVRNASEDCGRLARLMVENVDHVSAELTVALRKLLEAKDAYVRAVIADSQTSKDAW